VTVDLILILSSIVLGLMPRVRHRRLPRAGTCEEVSGWDSERNGTHGRVNRGRWRQDMRGDGSLRYLRVISGRPVDSQG
jgi:hypothetical protein